ncbi:DsbA family protein [Pseudonocardia acidicola]|uniref:DsbA family protein n=1 Tax=Pseudonocardia acidicola TaxID=2724939 RepID=UPI001B7CEDEA
MEAYIDFQSPASRQFQELAGPTLAELVRLGEIRLIYYPTNLLDGRSATQYSTRAAAAAGCAADAAKFVRYASTLFAHQPPGGGSGLTDDELIELGAAAGLSGPGFARCVRAGTYRDWPSYVTAAALGRGVDNTPSVFVDGHEVPARPDHILRAVHAVTG